MPNHVTAAAHEQRLSRPASYKIVKAEIGGRDCGWLAAGPDAGTSGGTAGTYWRQPARH